MDRLRIYCKCGCKDIVVIGRTYIRGHHNRNKSMSKLAVEKMRATIKKQYASGERIFND